MLHINVVEAFTEVGRYLSRLRAAAGAGRSPWTPAASPAPVKADNSRDHTLLLMLPANAVAHAVVCLSVCDTLTLC